MKKKVVFKGEVQCDSWTSKNTDPPSVVFDVKYPLSPVPIIEQYYNPNTEKIEEYTTGYNDFGLIHLALPGNYRVKAGQKITITIE